MTTIPTTALLYLRASSSNDAAIAYQRSRCTAYAEARGWRILDVVVDNGIGGGTKEPAGLEVLRVRIARGEAQAVIATDLARISRDPDRVRAFARFCRQHGVHLCLADQAVSVDAMLDPADGGRLAFFERLYTARESGL
jgi:DNA invertase Pin-like site-specific DNA recombinase